MAFNRTKNNPYERVPTNSGQTTSDSLFLESQNDMRMEELANKVSQLHKVTIDIHGLVDDQNNLLDESSTTFDQFGTALSSARLGVKKMMGRQNRRLLMYTIIVVTFIILILYFLINRTPTESSTSDQNTEPKEEIYA